MGKARKAILAGLSAAASVIIAAVTTGGGVPTTGEGWAGMLGGALTAGVTAGWATYRVPNDGQTYASR